MAQCTSTSKQSGKQCKKDAVQGYTVCHIHGGKTPRGADSPNLTHGIYSLYLSASLKEKLTTQHNHNPLDLMPELEVQRALLAEHLSRFKEGFRLSAQDIDYMMRWSAEISKSVERIVKMKNDTALTQAEVQFLALRVMELIGKYVDPDKQHAFVAEFAASIPARLPETVG